MVNEAPTLNPQAVEIAAPPGRGMWGYYRKRNGWIVQGPTTPTNRSDMEYMGHTFLPQYGQYQLGTREATSAPKATDANGVPWNPAMEPWRLIFQRGGAKEFPVDQLIAYHWHVNPPYREVRFAQLDGVDVIDLPCPECERFFSSLNGRESAHQLRTHLTTKMDARHSYTVNDLKELGTEYEVDFETSRTGARKRDLRREPESIESTPGEVIELSVSSPDRLEAYACPEGCGWAPPTTSRNPQAAQRMHLRHCKVKR